MVDTLSKDMEPEIVTNTHILTKPKSKGNINMFNVVKEYNNSMSPTGASEGPCQASKEDLLPLQPVMGKPSTH